MLMAKGNSPRPAPPPGEFRGRIRIWVRGLLLLSLVVFVRSLFTAGTLLGQGQVREGKKSVQRERRGDCFDMGGQTRF
jgi:hypothetical protein